MDMKLTQQDVWLSTVVFTVLALLSGIPLFGAYSPELFRRSPQIIIMVSAVFWGALAVVLGWRFWDLYYRHFYPPWMRRLMPLSALLYGGIGYLLWVVSGGGDLSPISVFLFLGGVAGILEHAFAIVALGLFEKVPILRDLSTGPVLVFSFVEYAFYWSLVGWISRAAAMLIY
jgi:hypothetical protein